MHTTAVTVRSLVELALPVTCAACSEPGEWVCQACQVGLADCLWPGGPRPVRPEPCPPLLPPVHAGGRYEGPLARLVGAYKDDGRRDCAELLGEQLGRAVDAGLAALPAAALALAHRNGPLLAVPVPSSRAARRSRGDAPLITLAEVAVRGYAPDEVVVADALRPRRRVADQAGLSAKDRAINLEHSMGVRRRWEPTVSGAVCLVVDDVLTTGATLVEAGRALWAGGAIAVVAATICATQRRIRPPSGPYANVG